jgi:superfamily II DNA or RNA helicase
MKELRPYQSRAVADIRTLLAAGKRPVVVAPTGSGKSIIAADVIRHTKGRVLWVAHRIELLRQARTHLLEAGIDDVGIVSGVETMDEEARVIVASIDTLRARGSIGAKLIVIDEAHRVMADSYQTIVESNARAALFGLTATPWRLDGRGLGATFDTLLVAARPVGLIVDGYLASPLTFAVPSDEAASMVAGVATTSGDYAPHALGRVLMRKKFMGDIVEECQKRAPKAKTLVFAASREHGRALAFEFNTAGRRVGYVDGETPTAERSEILRLFGSQGERAVDVVVNVEVLAEGFDLPVIKCVVLARPTKSLTRYLQHVGRASRPMGRSRSIILDHAGNCYRHGLAQFDREWSLDDRLTGGSGEMPVKKCPNCEAMIHAALKICPECGAEQPRPSDEVEAERVALERVRMDEAERARVIKTIADIAKTRRLDAEWIAKAVALVLGDAA